MGFEGKCHKGIYQGEFRVLTVNKKKKTNPLFLGYLQQYITPCKRVVVGSSPTFPFGRLAHLVEHLKCVTC